MTALPFKLKRDRKLVNNTELFNRPSPSLGQSLCVFTDFGHDSLKIGEFQCIPDIRIVLNRSATKDDKTNPFHILMKLRYLMTHDGNDDFECDDNYDDNDDDYDYDD